MSLVRIKFVYVAIIAVLMLGLVGYVERMRIADALWEEFRLGTVAYFLDPTADRAFAMGNYYFNWNFEGAYDLERAEYFYQEALGHNPNLSGPWYQLGRIDFLKGNFDAAVFKLNRQINLHPDVREPFYNRSQYVRGLTYGYMERYDRAEKDFQDLLERTEEDAHWAYYVDLGWLYFSQGKFKELGQASAEGIVHYPNNPWILSNLGLALMNLDQPEAVFVFEFALEEANKLTLDDWQRAYPGNDPRLAAQGLSEMIAAIEENLVIAVDK